MARRKPRRQPSQINLGPGPCWMLEQRNKRSWETEAQSAVTGDWTPALGMDRSKLWPMSGNLQEA